MRVKKAGATFRPAGYSSEEDDAYGFGDVYDPDRPVERSHNTSGPSAEPVDYFEDFSRETNKGNLQGVTEALKNLGATLPSKIDRPFSGGWNALMNACHLGFVEIAEFLLQKGADPHFHNHELFTPLMATCSSYCENEENVLQCIKLLIRNEVNVDDADHHGMTALMYACKSGRVSVIQALLDNNANLNLQDSQGWTALFWAVNNGTLSTVEILVNAGARKKKKDGRGRTVFQFACGRGSPKPIVDFLCPRKLRGEFVTEPENEDSDLEVEEEKFPFEFVNSEMPRIQKVNIGSRKLTKETFPQQGLDITTFLTITDDELLAMGVKYPWHRRQALEYIHNIHLQPWKKRENKTSKEKKVEPVCITYATATKHALEFCTRLSHIQAAIAYLANQCPLERMIGTEKAQRKFSPKASNTTALAKRQIDLVVKILKNIKNKLEEADKVVSPSDLLTIDAPRKFSPIYSCLLISLVGTCTVGAVLMWKKSNFVGASTGMTLLSSMCGSRS